MGGLDPRYYRFTVTLLRERQLTIHKKVRKPTFEEAKTFFLAWIEAAHPGEEYVVEGVTRYGRGRVLQVYRGPRLRDPTREHG